MTKSIESPHNIYLAQSHLPGAGRGVFAKQKISQGTLIERCPVILLSKPKTRAHLRKTELVNYYFLWSDEPPRAAICLGWGSIYNHSFSPNARFENQPEDCRMDFYAVHDIEAGEEIFVNYNGSPDDTRPLAIRGIPESAGGLPTRSGLSRIVHGFVRRSRLLMQRVSPLK